MFVKAEYVLTLISYYQLITGSIAIEFETITKDK